MDISPITEQFSIGPSLNDYGPASINTRDVSSYGLASLEIKASLISTLYMLE